MKVLYIYPSWTGEYGFITHFAKRAGVFPPLNLALLAAISEQGGHQAEIIEAEANGIPMEKLIPMAVKKQPDIVCLTGMSPFFHLAKKFAQGFKELNPNTPIVVGGQHITIMKEQCFTSEFDYGFVGECEDTWNLFLDRIQNGKDISDIKGMLYHSRTGVVFTGKHLYLRDLDKLPLPARHLLPMHKYFLGTLQGKKNFTSIQTMRGCPWKCIFCASEALNTTSVGKRSPESVVEEIKACIAQYNIRHFMILDDVLTLDRSHIERLCDLIIANDLNITFEGSTRANLINEPLVKKMKQAGLLRLSFGLETVDSEMRKTMNKKVPLEHYTKANELLHKYDIEALNSVMLGLPGETRDSIWKTLEFLRKDRHVKQANFAIAVPYPGTEFHEIAKKGEKGMTLLTDDFSEYRRYGTAVTSVNGMGPEELIELQNEGFVSIYSAPWRWKPMLRKHGVIGGMLMLWRVFRLANRKILGKTTIGNAPAGFEDAMQLTYTQPLNR